MGDCDSYKKHISDYLEGNLDKTTRKNFEQAMERSEELSRLTTRTGEVSALLGNLSAHECSDDFSVRLRKKIHAAETHAGLPITPLKKYSYAFSFAAALIIIVFAFNMLNDDTSGVNTMPAATNIQSSNPQPTLQTPSQPVSNSPVSSKQVDIKTVDEQKAITDSTDNREKSENEKNFKYVDEKHK